MFSHFKESNYPADTETFYKRFQQNLNRLLMLYIVQNLTYIYCLFNKIVHTAIVKYDYQKSEVYEHKRKN